MIHESTDLQLRRALKSNGQRFTEQRAAVYRYLAGTDIHPTADEVFSAVCSDLDAISLATVYKSLETLVGCGLAVKLNYSDGSARYDGRMDPHYHSRCLACGCITDIPGEIASPEIQSLSGKAADFQVIGYSLELTGYCATCVPEGGPGPIRA